MIRCSEDRRKFHSGDIIPQCGGRKDNYYVSVLQNDSFNVGGGTKLPGDGGTPQLRGGAWWEMFPNVGIFAQSKLDYKS